ncbi:hypothetical protein [Bacillus sp. 3255]|uniref:hypothetical protein n=1 Tax=Bacillus sp. 3255 TaxID=2817904 RepID=UPI00285B3B3C|nr:hypothetical protein [Bacillus sp. 3255]MDR6878778.1 hypothetical protein [Bacillus sp. 3255]
MRHEFPAPRLHVGNPVAERFADSHYHHGFHGGPILGIVIGLILLILVWVMAKRIHNRRTDINQLAVPAFMMDEHTVMYSASSAQRAATLDQWERNVLKEEK